MDHKDTGVDAGRLLAHARTYCGPSREFCPRKSPPGCEGASGVSSSGNSNGASPMLERPQIVTTQASIHF